jgi:hypothetical protein
MSRTFEKFCLLVIINKTYLLVLASSGTREVETLAIRHQDIDFTVNPTKIYQRRLCQDWSSIQFIKCALHISEMSIRRSEFDTFLRSYGTAFGLICCKKDNKVTLSKILRERATF